MNRLVQQSKRTPQQVFEEITQNARAYRAANTEAQRREELRRILDQLVQEYQELTSERVVY